ncbi:hypothetical protein A9Q99_21140 [Gammaproteobacteria bacterium 45_16_T64]|nr:hypothetical protein A9Q99_21140 [Gammaproteobacteria bacterium 45_16_T64]
MSIVINTIKAGSCATLLLVSGCDLIKDIPVGIGYAAKNICSSYFLSELDYDTLTKEHVAPQIAPLGALWKIHVDEDKQTVQVNDIIFGNANTYTAYYREGFGCTLLHDSTIAKLDQQIPLRYTETESPSEPWPFGKGENPIIAGVDYAQLDDAVDNAFIQLEDPANTLAVAVIYKGNLIAEQYADGVDEDTRLIGWSMTKSFTATMIGKLADDGLLNITGSAPVPEWQGTNKEAITIEHLLHMASGLEWSETAQGDTPDQGNILFLNEDFAKYYIEKPLLDEPGTVHNYSTGSSALLSRIVQDQVGGTLADTYRFVNEEILHPINIYEGVLEFDTVGQPSGGANLYLSARDWAKLGQLYLNGGDWYGNQVLSQDWVDYALTPSIAKPTYGAQLWVNNNQESWPYLPESTFAFTGFHKQIVLVIPEHDLIIVRLGVTLRGTDFDLSGLSEGVIASLPE